jgi:uncharacterized protein YfaT (DUF1175 family)
VNSLDACRQKLEASYTVTRALNDQIERLRQDNRNLEKLLNWWVRIAHRKTKNDPKPTPF